ncbi:MAG: ABC transporter permease [Microthrixaceae bacterium]
MAEPTPESESAGNDIESLAAPTDGAPSLADVVAAPMAGFPAEPEAPDEPARKRKLGPAAILAIMWMVFVVGAALLAPLLLPSTTETIDGLAQQPPSLQHPFGGDKIGKDVFSLTVNGGRVSLLVGFVAVGVGLLVGGSLGIMAGYFRGKTDAVLSVLFDTFLAIPAVLLALALVAAFDPADPNQIDPQRRMWVLAFALGVVSIPILGRIARASTLAVADREFVLAAKAMGAKPVRIMWREVLPNVLPAMLSIGLLGMGVAIVAEGGLALLGASVSSPSTSWGAIIAANRGEINADRPWVIFGPSLFIFLTVLTLNYLGDVIRRRFDVRESVL